VVSFPEVAWEYWDKWLLKDGLVFSGSYTVTVKLNSQNDVADRAGLTIAWDDTNWDRIDIQANVYSDDIEFRPTYRGPIQSSPTVARVGRISIDAGYNYWLRVVAVDNGPGQGQVRVYWSTDGISYDLVLVAEGMANLAGLVGVSTAGPHLPSVTFDDFQAAMN
jgi:regulation of enolase protein 1 (concanavalin A-like superfamily)